MKTTKESLTAPQPRKKRLGRVFTQNKARTGGRESQSEARQVCSTKSVSIAAANETVLSFCVRPSKPGVARPPLKSARLIGRLPVASPYCFFQSPSEYTR